LTKGNLGNDLGEEKGKKDSRYESDSKFHVGSINRSL